MSEKAAPPGVSVRIIKASEPAPVMMAEQLTHLEKENAGYSGDWLEPPVNQTGLRALVSHSTILPQCIRAYRNNIAGFGIGVRYKEDPKGKETPEMVAEYDLAVEVLELLHMDKDTKEVFEDSIDIRETYGISYLEVIRDVADKVIEVDLIKDTPTVRKTKPLPPYVDVEYFYKGKVVPRKRKFRKYRQQIGTETVYFKEIGDPRIMNKNTGDYLKNGETLPIDDQANEILELSIGTEPYGEVRWIGQTLGVDGSRKAESLNNRYFEDGRHTPLLILVKGGTLTDSSFDKLQGYMNDIKGEKGQHAFLLLEAESADNRTELESDKQPEVQVIPLASVLQKDELFQGYLDNNRRKVQSSFQLPDLYVGYTTDFNRATAQTAVEVTEKQVFQPERGSLAWHINNKLLAGYRFQYVEAYLKAPDISNPEDIARILNVTERAGGLTPNKAKELTYSTLGETSEDYDGDWGNTPLQYLKSVATPSQLPSLEELGIQLSAQIQKAQSSSDDKVVAVMKEVRKLLVQMQEEGTPCPAAMNS